MAFRADSWSVIECMLMVSMSYGICLIDLLLGAQKDTLSQLLQQCLADKRPKNILRYVEQGSRRLTHLNIKKKVEFSSIFF
jgi:hypothetical protein